MSVLILADDLTGACDAAVQFRLRGASCLVHLGVESPALDTFEVNSYSANSRDLPPIEIEWHARRAAESAAQYRADILFKKIDSTMRGNPGIEIRIALECFGYDVAVITPAFPDLGRTVEHGLLSVKGDSHWRTLNVVERLHHQGLVQCALATPQTLERAIVKGHRHLAVDASSDADLDVIAAAGFEAGKRILWAGSGGLAAALARHSYSGNAGPIRFKEALNRPVLFCIGSDHPATARQVSALKSSRAAEEIHANTATPDSLANALRRGHTVLRISRDRTSTERIHALVKATGHLFGALMISGGDTAALVSQSLGVTAIELQDQLLAGLPVGTFADGHFAGLPVATKSGGFGDADALLRVADYFTEH